jgi:peptidyl-tRNA hydrolase
VEHDPWVMYFVVRKDLRLDIQAAVALAGGATIACARRFGESHAAAFRAWHGSAVRKVAVRASAEELEAVLAAHEGFLDERGLACLPPLQRSQAGEPLGSLSAFTDAKRPAEPTPQPPPGAVALTYVLAAELGLSQGKAMAQAGHGALMCADDPRLGDRGPRAADWRAWVAAGHPARVIEADPDRFAAFRQAGGGAVVRDAGFTQVAPGTVTVICLPPGPEPAPAAERQGWWRRLLARRRAAVRK